mgnify:CR=1 FL=1
MVDELHVATHGTAGPACARQHHRALGDTALGWHDNEWIEPPGGSGRDLVWFPEPIAANDCYRAALAGAQLLYSGPGTFVEGMTEGRGFLALAAVVCARGQLLRRADFRFELGCGIVHFDQVAGGFRKASIL